MPTVTAGSTGSSSLTARSTVDVTLDTAERAVVRVVNSAGQVVFADNVSGTRTLGPFPSGATVSLTAIGGSVVYTVAAFGSSEAGATLPVSADITVTSLNASTYNGQVLEFTTAATVTLSAGLPVNFGFAAIPPSSGNASIASAGGTLLNGATTTITRAAASNALFAVVARVSAADSYVVSGS